MAANLHSAGATPSLLSVKELGFDIKWQETWDRHRQYQAVVASSGTLVGDGATDDNYLHGFQTIDAATVFLTGQAAWTSAVSAAGGVPEGGAENGPIVNGAGQIVGIAGPFSFPSESFRA